MSDTAQVVLGIVLGWGFIAIVFYFAAIGLRVRQLKARVAALESELRPKESYQTWHYSINGQRRCGNDLPNTAATQIAANVTCSDCRRLMMFDRNVAVS